ncbi:yibQ protein [Fimbriiglobus ruber]|uniref:YibQ protein n=1 Tax=Fimbriiglobus ruber TaxID=1908690 RepID=A0A225E4T6_9BACT|nr:yibQ protein [Fimbriiglobus ruber]
MFHGNKWGWRLVAARLLVAPVLAAGAAAPVVAQTSPPAKAAAAPVVAQTSPPAKAAAAVVPKSGDPKELLRAGREALKAGQFDRALDLAKQADSVNKGGRWGLFDDTPESLEKDIKAARDKANKAEAERLTKAAKELSTKPARTPGEKIATLDQAYSLADRAVALHGPSDFFDDVFGSGDRPDKVKKDIDLARIQLRKTHPGLVAAKPAVAPGAKTPAGGSPVQQAGAVNDASKVAVAGATTPATALSGPAARAQASKLVADGRALLKQNMLVEAKAKATEAQKLNATFGPTEDSPAALAMAVAAEGKKRVDRLIREADERTAKKEFVKADEALTNALVISSALGFYTKSIEDQRAAVRKSSGSGITVASVVPAPSIPLPSANSVTQPAGPAAPTRPIVLAPAAGAIDVVKPVTVTPAVATTGSNMAVPTLPSLGLTAPMASATPAAQTAKATPVPTPVLPAPTIPPPDFSPAAVAVIPVPAPAPAPKPIDVPGPVVVPAPAVVASASPATGAVGTKPAPQAGAAVLVPGIPAVVLADPVVPAGPAAPVPVVVTPPVPTAPAPVAVVPTMLPPALGDPTAPTVPSIAAVEVPAPAGPKGPTGRELLDRAATALKHGDTSTAHTLAQRAFGADPAVKEEALQLLRTIDGEEKARAQADIRNTIKAVTEAVANKEYDTALGILREIGPEVPADQRAKYDELTEACKTGLAKLKTPGTLVAAKEAPPGAPKPAAGGLTDQVKALSEVEFQKLRSEGLEAEAKAQAAFNRGETDVAITMLTEFSAAVKKSSLAANRQALLLGSVDRRLDNFRIMKRQMDFYTNEAKTKRDSRELVAGKQLAEQQKKEEIGKKVREINELTKAHKYREAEMLALQIKSLDPEDPTLTALYELSKRQRAVQDYKQIKDDKEKMFLNGLNASEREGPYVDIDNPLYVDVNRSLIAMGRGSGADLYQRTRSQAEREIELRLERPLSIEFAQPTPMREVLHKLRAETKLNITVDDASLADEGISLDQVLVTETLNNSTLRNVLELLLDKARLKFVIANDTIRVTTEKKAKGRLITKVFSVMELVTPVPDFALADHQSLSKGLAKMNAPPGWMQAAASANGYSPNKGLGGGELRSQSGAGGTTTIGSGGTLQNQQTPLKDSANLAGTTRQNTSQQLMRLITGMVHPYSWSDLGGAGKIDYYDIGGALVVNQTADVIREVQDLLESLRRLQETSVSVEVRVIALSEEFYERVGVDFQMNITPKQSSSLLNFESSLTTGQFAPEPYLNSINSRGVTVGYNPTSGGFTPDLGIPIGSSSYGLATPPFGGYNGTASNSGGLGVGLAFLNDIQVYMFMEASQGDRRVNTMQAPKITLFNGQTSTVFVSDVAFFTMGLQVFNVGGQFVYLPQQTGIPIGSSPAPTGAQTGTGLGQGVSVTVQAIVSADRRFVRLNLTPSLSSLTSATVPLFPVTAFITPVFEGGSQGVPIPFTQFFQQPSITEINVQTTVAVPDGGTVVLGGLKTLSEGRNEFGPPVLSEIPYLNRLFRNQAIGRETRHIMIMVTPRIIIQSEEELNQTGNGAQFGTQTP